MNITDICDSYHDGTCFSTKECDFCTCNGDKTKCDFYPYITSSEPHILDSGTRREFESGAVRDICEGKGRCDLLPLDVVAEFMDDKILKCLANFKDSGRITHLYNCLNLAREIWRDNGADLAIVKDCTMILEVAKHFEEGCKKYGDDNWQKGIPIHCYLDSATRHYLKYLRGDTDEPHNRAFVWNVMCAIWTCMHKPELNEYAGKGE